MTNFQPETVEVVQNKDKSKTSKILISLLLFLVALLIIAAGSFAWFYYYGPCGKTLVKKASLEISNLIDDWDNANQLASSTSRIALSGPVGRMQDISNQAKSIKVPSCMENEKDLLLSHMDALIESYLQFMSESSDLVVYANIETATKYRSQFTIESLRILKCSPFCSNP